MKDLLVRGEEKGAEVFGAEHFIGILYDPHFLVQIAVMKVGVPVEPGTYEIVVDQFCGFFIRERHGSHYVSGRSASPFIEIPYEVKVED